MLDINDNFNYYEYGWMNESEGASVANYVALGSLIGLLGVCVYFVAGTRLLRFIQFFLINKHYANLTIKVTRTTNLD